MSAIITRAGSTSLAPQTFTEAVEFSKMLARSGMVPKDYVGKPENIMVALQWGAEVGLGPLQALNNISIINGRPSLWGDAALALARGHPACAGVREGVDGEGDQRHGWCEVTRRGEAPQRREFSIADAKRAGLFGKQGPWQQYPDRMLQLRARGFALRDVFPDALRGVITAEEAADMPAADAPTPLPPARGPAIEAERAPIQSDFLMLGPDGIERSAPNEATWLRWCEAAIGRMESPAALRSWLLAMEPHIEGVSREAALRLHDAVNRTMQDVEDASAQALNDVDDARRGGGA